jgi:hypothetical protein
VLDVFLKNKEKEPGNWYLHHIDVSPSNPEAGMIAVTMNVQLAQLVHSANYTIHDNTYKRVGDSGWYEWEVVIWYAPANRRELSASIAFGTLISR